jgi:hypothetical protein
MPTPRLRLTNEGFDAYLPKFDEHALVGTVKYKPSYKGGLPNGRAATQAKLTYTRWDGTKAVQLTVTATATASGQLTDTGASSGEAAASFVLTEIQLRALLGAFGASVEFTLDDGSVGVLDGAFTGHPTADMLNPPKFVTITPASPSFVVNQATALDAAVSDALGAACAGIVIM